METKYRARIETTVAGERKSIPVLPRSRKTTTFKTIGEAVTACERRKVAGRALIYPAHLEYANHREWDWSLVWTAAL